MNKDSILQIADTQDDFLDRMSSLHQARLQKAIADLEKRIVDRVSSLDTTAAGALVGPKTNLAQSQKIHSDLTQLFDEEYGAAARTSIEEYQKALPRIQAYYKEMGEAAEFTGIDKKMIETLKAQDLSEYAQFGQLAQDKIAASMYDSVVAQAPFSSLVASIAGALTGHKDARGNPLSNYAKQMANDGIMNFHNSVMMKKGEDLGFDTFLYYGNIIKDSRPFCIQRAGNVYTKEQIQGWTFPWQGKSGPAMSHRGGYNCRHHWQPVRKGWLPEGGIEVQSTFDRVGVMPVSLLPPAVREAPKFKAYNVWQRSIHIDKKPMTALQVATAAGTKKTPTAEWISRWKKGMDLPAGWQSAVRDIEAEAGGFVRTVPGPDLPTTPITPPATVAKVVPAASVQPAAAAETTNFTIKQKGTGYEFTNKNFKPPPGETVTLYHDTSAEFAPSIMSKGLLPGGGQNRPWGANIWGTKTDPTKFELNSTGRPPAIIKMRVPKELAEKVPQQGWIVNADSVPPEWIESVSVYPSKKSIYEKIAGQVVPEFKGFEPVPIPDDVLEFFGAKAATQATEKAAIAIQVATKDALTIAKEEIETAFKEYQAVYKEMLDEGYQSIGGVGRMTGAPGESEVTMIRLLPEDKVAAVIKEATKLSPKEFLEHPLFKELKDLDFSDLGKHPVWSKVNQAGAADEVMERLANIAGYDGLPQLVPAKEFAATKGLEMARGIAASTADKTKQYVDDFIQGKYFAGKGVWGNGTYTAYGDTRLKVASEYADLKNDGRVLEMKLKPEARVVGHRELRKMEDDFVRSFSGRGELEKFRESVFDMPKGEAKDLAKEKYVIMLREVEALESKLKVVVQDPGRLALLLGYDAIEVASQEYMVILNRGMLVIKEG